VRRDAGMFDVSHMCVVDLRGERVREYLRRLLANDVAKLVLPGKALYSCMLREHGGVIDDLIVYFLDEQWFRMVVNAGTRDKDLEWLRAHAGHYGVSVEPRFDLAMIAVQGPNARAKAASLLDPPSRRVRSNSAYFFGAEADDHWFRRAHGLHGRGRLRVMLPPPRPRASGRGSRRRVWRPAASAPATRCGSRRA